jgi:hypothetical protein
MKSEAKKLFAKIRAIYAYTKTEEYAKLPGIEQNLCHQQMAAMQTYYNCLIKRIATAEEIDLFVMACHAHQEVDCKICLIRYDGRL